MSTPATQPTPLRAPAGIRLLADLRHVFTTHSTDRMTTADILTALHDLDESGWADLHGKPLDARRIGRELSKYGVRPKAIKINGHAHKGYRADGADGLTDAWSRYLPPAATAATTVADTTATPDIAATHLTSQVAAVADMTNPEGEPRR